MIPGRHVRCKGGLKEEVQGEFLLQEYLVSEEVGEVIRDADEDGKEVRFKIVDGAFGYIAAMDIRREKLESPVPLVNNGSTILGAVLILEDLEINAVAFGFEARNDDVVGSQSMPVLELLER